MTPVTIESDGLESQFLSYMGEHDKMYTTQKEYNFRLGVYK